MSKFLTTFLAATAVTIPMAAAQIDAPEEGVPYTITFDGTHYPAGLDTVDYPYSAGRVGLSGECQLNVYVDDQDDIAMMTITSCSDSRFRDESRQFIESQTFTGSASSDLKSHSLVIDWSMEPEPTPVILAAN